jgi:hypothetical protein
MLLKPRSSLKDGAQSLYSKKNIVSYAGVDHNSPYLVVNTVVSYPSTPTTKGKGWSGEDLSNWLRTFVSVCLFPKQVFYVKGEGRGES